MESEIFRIPDEILEHIFTFLDFKDRLIAALVCKKWLSVLDCKQLLENIIVTFCKNDSKEGISVFQCMSRKFTYFAFKSVYIDGESAIFLNKFCNQLISLSFHKCELIFEELDGKVLGIFNNLKVLNIVNCDAYFLFKSVPRVIIFSTDSKSFSDRDLAKFENSMNNLEQLSILFPVTSDNTVLKRFYPEGKTFENHPSDLILSFAAVVSFIRKRVHSIIGLCVNGERLTLSGAKQLSEITDLRLKTLDSCNLHNFKEFLLEFLPHQSSLLKLQIYGCSEKSDGVIPLICQLLPKLKTLCFVYCALKDNGIQHVFQLKNIHTINLTGCRNIPALSFKDAALNFQSFKLKNLCLYHTQIDTGSISQLVSKAANLQDLNLSSCDVTDENVQQISQCLHFLKYLRLAFCREITDEGFLGKETDNDAAKPLSNISGLILLDLHGCKKITDQGLTGAVRFQKLETLDIRECPHITSTAVYVVLENNPRLKRIFFEIQLEDCRWDLNDMVNYVI